MKDSIILFLTCPYASVDLLKTVRDLNKQVDDGGGRKLLVRILLESSREQLVYSVPSA